MVLTDFITFKDVYDRWRRSFPIVLDFDATYITDLNRVGELTYYEDKIYRVIAKGFDGSTVPDTDTTHFEVTDEDICDYISQDLLEEYLILADSKFIDTSKFLLKYDEFDQVIQDSEYKCLVLAAQYLVAYIIVDETYMRQQGIGASSKLTRTMRNQSHMSETINVPLIIRNSPVLSSYGNNQYGINYVNAVYPRFRGLNGFIIQTRDLI